MGARRGVAALVLAGLITAWASPSAAQTGQTAQIPLQFDFLNPGARSLGLGSAFVAVADDATAAFTNPAGLTALTRPEVSAEMRLRRLGSPFLKGGRISGTVTNQGQDTTSGPVYGESIDSAFRPYFLSVVYPRGKMSFSAYRHELVLQSNEFETNGAFDQAMFAGTLVNNSRQFALRGTRDIRINNYGAAVGVRANDRVSAGIGLALYQFSLDASFASFGHVESVFGATDPNDRTAATTQDGDRLAAAINAGLLVAVTPKVQVGAVFRQGTSFAFTQVTDVRGEPQASAIGNFRTPHVFGVGLRARPSNELVVAIDIDRVMYSRLEEDYVQFQVDPTVRPQISVANGTELHIGFDYTLVNVKRTPSIRAGVWFDPNHSIQYKSDNTAGQGDLRLQAIFPGGKDVWHYCLGGGVPLSSLYEVNVGLDLAGERRYFATSIIARFGG